MRLARPGRSGCVAASPGLAGEVRSGRVRHVWRVQFWRVRQAWLGQLRPFKVGFVGLSYGEAGKSSHGVLWNVRSASSRQGCRGWRGRERQVGSRKCKSRLIELRRGWHVEVWCCTLRTGMVGSGLSGLSWQAMLGYVSAGKAVRGTFTHGRVGPVVAGVPWRFVKARSVLARLAWRVWLPLVVVWCGSVSLGSVLFGSVW